ncbi:MAG: CoA-binding protein [bacterium]|nr:CoA-binding protein [bacterium]
MAQKKLAVVGVSRKKSKFGSVIFRELKQRDYGVFPINAYADTIEGEKCYPDLKSLPEPVDGAVIVVPPAETEKVVKDAAEAGISRVWIQQGAHSDAAVAFCKKNNIAVVSKECILMFADPTAHIHKFHRWLWKIFGKLPK